LEKQKRIREEQQMKIYKKIMNAVTIVENTVLALSMILILVLTFGNVVARKVFNHSWGFTDEIVVAVFVLISLLAAGVAAKEGGLVNLGLISDNAGPKAKKLLLLISTVICVCYSAILTWEAIGQVRKELAMPMPKTSPILHIPTYYFWGFVVVGGISLLLHFIEYFVDYCAAQKAEGKEG
jgi:TRAP-type C4-dicarboxylate transport system permease small subunit